MRTGLDRVLHTDILTLADALVCTSSIEDCSLEQRRFGDLLACAAGSSCSSHLGIVAALCLGSALGFLCLQSFQTAPALDSSALSKADQSEVYSAVLLVCCPALDSVANSQVRQLARSLRGQQVGFLQAAARGRKIAIKRSDSYRMRVPPCERQCKVEKYSN